MAGSQQPESGGPRFGRGGADPLTRPGAAGQTGLSEKVSGNAAPMAKSDDCRGFDLRQGSNRDRGGFRAGSGARHERACKSRIDLADCVQWPPSHNQDLHIIRSRAAGTRSVGTGCGQPEPAAPGSNDVAIPSRPGVSPTVVNSGAPRSWPSAGSSRGSPNHPVPYGSGFDIVKELADGTTSCERHSPRTTKFLINVRPALAR
jgi:hypothetical protein